jgi:RNA ligase (TIGR02306 family)
MKYKPVRWLLAKFFIPKKDKCKWPDWLPKTGSERIQNLPHLFGSNDKYIITEKVDGTSTSFILNEKDKYLVCSHNVIKNPDKNSDGGNYYKENVWAESGAKYNVESVLRDLKKSHKLKTVAIQGETYGDGIQKRTYSLKHKHDFAVFHIWFDGVRLSIKDMIAVCDKYNLPHVHVYDYDYSLPSSVEEIIFYVDKCRSAIDNGDIEGFVFYSQDGQTNFKCVSPNFLLKYHR